MTEAEERFAIRLADEIERLVDRGVIVDDVEIEGESPATVRVLLRYGEQSSTVEATGETVVDALPSLVHAAAEASVAIAFRRLMTELRG